MLYIYMLYPLCPITAKLKSQVTKDGIDKKHKESSLFHNFNMIDIILKGDVK